MSFAHEASARPGPIAATAAEIRAWSDESGSEVAGSELRRELGGAVARVPNEATAFAHRDKAFYIAADNAWEDDDPQPARHTAWTEDAWRALAPHTDGTYAGFLDDEGDAPGARRLPTLGVLAAGRDQAPLRPPERLPPEPQHRAAVRR